MALKKSDLYGSLWSSADELRGSMDASQYKDYVLTLLFVKYVSDKSKIDPYSLIQVPEDGSFDYLVTLKGKPDVGEKVNVAIRRLAEENSLQGVINNADFDDPTKLGSGKDLQDRVSNLIGIFQDIDFTGSRAEGDDLLGDAYEYLMRHFATQSGKSKGQFYTPSEVSRVIAQLLQIPNDAPKSTTVYDPTCGSGSLLIKVADSARNGLTIYGQENDNATWALARMNMILHGNETHEIAQGNTLSDPKFLDRGGLATFDYLVANPPFSVKTWRNGFENEFGRFDGFATPPDKNGDYAFLLHMIKSLKSTGRGAVILPHGVLFRGNAEGVIRKELVERGYIEGIIGLPANLFYGTGIAACILVLDKKGAQKRDGIFMVDASRGFEKDGPKNRLRPRDIHKIIDVYDRALEVERFSRFVSMDEIGNGNNDFSLNLSRYIDSSEPEDRQDLTGHIKGGVPNGDLDRLRDFWQALPGLRDVLFTELRPGYSNMLLLGDDLQSAVVEFKQYSVLSEQVRALVDKWGEKHLNVLTSISSETRPISISDQLGESLLAEFTSQPLLDPYAVYEQFMRYWNSVMHDDVSLIVGSGWVSASQPRPARSWKDKNNKTKYEEAHLTIGSGKNSQRWVTDLVPPKIVADCHFSSDVQLVLAAERDLDVCSEELTSFVDDNSGEEGLLWEAMSDDKITATSVKDRLRDARKENVDLEEVHALERVSELLAKENNAKKTLKKLQSELDIKVLKKLQGISTSEVQHLVVNLKWRKSIESAIEDELMATIQYFTSRLDTLGKRYRKTAQELDDEFNGLREKVKSHIALFGIS
jgi:type I restriction enzyme M protein